MRGKIEWSKTPVVVVKSLEEWNEVVGFFNANGQRVTNSRTVWLDWLGDNSYNFENIKGTYMLYATFYKDYEAAARNYPMHKTMAIISLLCEYDYLGKGGDGVETGAGELLVELVAKILSC